MTDKYDNKCVEDELQAEKERLLLVIEGTNVGLWDWNIQTGETVFNERWAQMIGYTLDELEPISIDTWVKYTHLEDLEKSNKLIEDHINGKTENYDYECRMRHKNGNWIWIHDRGKIVSWTEDGKPLRMAGTHSLITDRKEYEINLQKKEEKLNMILQTSLDGYFEADMKGNIREVNRAFCEISGFSREELLTMSIADIEAAETEADTSEHIKTIISEGADRFLTKHRKKGGGETDIEMSVIFHESENKGNFICFARDITLQKEAAENIDEVFWLRTGSKMLYISPAYEKVWGRSVESLYQNPDSFLESIYDKDREKVLEEFRNNYDNFDLEYRIVRPDGTIRWIWARTFIVKYEKENEIRRAGIAEDITRSKEVELQLKEAAIRQVILC